MPEPSELIFADETAVKRANLDLREYNEMVVQAIEDPARFWAAMAAELEWFAQFEDVYFWDEETYQTRWFEGGRLNVSYNCLDRHTRTEKRDKLALIWEPDTPGTGRTFTYRQLTDEVCRFANVLKSRGVTRGDRVAIYLPMVPELTVAMLACARIGAIHNVVFNAFSSMYLRDRILDAGCTTLITSDGGYCAGNSFQLKRNVDWALEECPDIERVFVVKRTGEDVNMTDGRDVWWHEELTAEGISSQCPPEEMDSEDPLFILYTSGSTGPPKGVLHTTAGYLLHVMLSQRWVFDLKDDDVWWCTGDLGWIVGHSYGVYAPLANGVTTLMYEGIPTYPKPDRFWDIVEKDRVTSFYTEPTVIRSMMRLGDRWTKTRDISSLRVLGSVGEPIGPDVWTWYYETVGAGRCPVVDTWWQTETGGIMMSPLAFVTGMKPGSVGPPLPGVVPETVDDEGAEVRQGEGGFLLLRCPWPGMMRTVYQNHESFVNTYFSAFKGRYFTGDLARVDSDGFFYIQGRVDDVINVGGHRIGSADVEHALLGHPSVAEAAVVSMPDEIKGQGVYAYVTVRKDYEGTSEAKLREELRDQVVKAIGPIARPDVVQFAPVLPKTRSGKILRRILKRVASGETEDLGDTSTLDDPAVVELIIHGAREVREASER